MILEGFEIENWSCIKHLVVSDLPPTGIVVLHGPNGTGKSSIVEALRACLMDYKSTSKAIELRFPKNSTDKPRISVTFRSQGITWKITKQFNSKESKLESRMATSHWKLETADPSEAHERTRQLTGGSESNLGLHQLLWLTQAKFHLPEPKKFDANVQSRLREVLGVLQTPLDDRFIRKVKEEWSHFYAAIYKPGTNPKLKKDCPLDKLRKELERCQGEFNRLEEEFQSFEKRMERSNNLEVLVREMKKQREGKIATLDGLQQEFENSLKRLENHRRALERVAESEKNLADAKSGLKRRVLAENKVHTLDKLVSAAVTDVEEKGRQLELAEQQLRNLRMDLQALGNKERDFHARLSEVSERRQWLTLQKDAHGARERLLQVEQLAEGLEKLKKQARSRPAPDEKQVKQLQENRTKASQARAALDAAAMALALFPEQGAAPAQLAIDGGPVTEVGPSSKSFSIHYRAKVAIPGWGRAELTRGTDARSLDQIEKDLLALDHQFAEGLAPFGLPVSDPTALDQLLVLAAEKKVRDPELQLHQSDFTRLAPKGIDFLREEMAQLDKRVLAGAPNSTNLDNLTDASDLDRAALSINNEIKSIRQNSKSIENQIENIECAVNGPSQNGMIQGLRQKKAEAGEKLAGSKAAADVLRNELERMLTTEQINHEIQAAQNALEEACADLESAKLTEDEETVNIRLNAAKDSLQAIQTQLETVQTEFDQIKGAIGRSEGLHQRRAAVEARLEELKGRTEREELDAKAWDHLYALFEECREKQLGTVMGPIHDRVINWMCLLRIGGYQSIRFNDQFLPDTLIADGGATELNLEEESTGTIEQIALMVRLALGSTLSTNEEPVVALLDDPLTHSDVVRLDRMRAVLKSAAAGNPDTTPPAGPLQILILTCHPEWFSLDGAKTIDLASLMRREH